MAADNPEITQKLERLRQEVSDQPESTQAHLKLGSALARLGRWNEAEKALRRAVEIDPQCAGAWINLGGIHMARWEFDDCVAANQAAIAADPDLAIAHYNLGLAYLYAKQPQEMLGSFERVLELEPGNPAAQYHVAIALFELGNHDEAKARLAIAIDLGYSPQPEFIKAMERNTTAGVTTIQLGGGPRKDRDSKPN